MENLGKNLVPRLVKETKENFPDLSFSESYLEDIIILLLNHIKYSVNQILIQNGEDEAHSKIYKSNFFYLMVKIKLWQNLSGMAETIEKCKNCAQNLLSSMDISDKIKNSILEIIGIQTTHVNTPEMNLSY